MEFEMFHNPIGAFRRKADYNYEMVSQCHIVIDVRSKALADFRLGE